MTRQQHMRLVFNTVHNSKLLNTAQGLVMPTQPCKILKPVLNISIALKGLSTTRRYNHSIVKCTILSTWKAGVRPWHFTYENRNLTHE